MIELLVIYLIIGVLIVQSEKLDNVLKIEGTPRILIVIVVLFWLPMIEWCFYKVIKGAIRRKRIIDALKNEMNKNVWKN